MTHSRAYSVRVHMMALLSTCILGCHLFDFIHSRHYSRTLSSMISIQQIRRASCVLGSTPTAKCVTVSGTNVLHAESRLEARNCENVCWPIQWMMKVTLAVLIHLKGSLKIPSAIGVEEREKMKSGRKTTRTARNKIEINLGRKMTRTGRKGQRMVGK